MEEHVAALHTATNALQALGRGFDVNFDTRLLYCKGGSGSRVVEIDEQYQRDLFLYDDVVVPNVSRDIRSFPEPMGRLSSGVCSFQEMVDYFNHKASISGSFPLGSFNSAFSFTGSKHVDAAATKTLSSDGFYIPLAKVQLQKSNLMLQENVKRAIPVNWDPPSLASFIENFGTHVITSITIGGKDVIYVKQHHTSPLSKLEIKNYIQDIGNHRFSDINSHTSSGQTKSKDKGVEPFSFNSQGIYPQPTTATYPTGKEDVTVIFRRRGGDDLEQNHSIWLETVKSSPDIIEMTFCPITDLLEEIPAKEHLTRAIGLYLEYKPPIEELRYFLEFQIPRVWAPLHDRVPGQQRKEPVCPSLQFSIMGQKLYVSQEQITVGRRPVTGIRLCLEGNKQNRLSVHLQHLVSLPKILQPYWDSHVAIGAPKWQGPEEQDSRWFEPVKWKNFSHVSTAPIENPETFIGDFSGVYIVTGAQLGVWDFGSRNVLYMKLLYSRLPGCTIRRSLWDHIPNTSPKSSTAGNTSNTDNSTNLGSRENNITNKLVKYVDLSELSKGPEDPPGHWLVTGGKLGVEKGKIVLRLKYSLLNY
ncbi:putative membrane attack complex component/perforin (MACPF) domain-containing protein [Medicago truncatula]|nr:MACPF domain-containing protein CAD1-like [Medicago truncatula]RHN59413.1 putative membrane attack complex component/perforin (MACPF) domain-containing protein [Medicago truncatula]